MKKVNKNIATTALFTVGQYATVLSPDAQWSIGLTAFLTLTAGAWEISKILFDGIDIDKLKKQIEESPEQARLFWSIIDSSLKEASKEKLNIYNKYLISAHCEPMPAIEYNSKILLVIQQLTLSEMRLFTKICDFLDDLKAINLIHNKDEPYYKKETMIDSVSIEKWLKNNPDLKEKIRLDDVFFFQEDVKKHKEFNHLNFVNEIDMLSSYGLLRPIHGLMNGTAYDLTNFGKYFLDFLDSEKELDAIT